MKGAINDSHCDVESFIEALIAPEDNRQRIFVRYNKILPKLLALQGGYSDFPIDSSDSSSIDFPLIMLSC